jgi:hypothetical protein
VDPDRLRKKRSAFDHRCFGQVFQDPILRLLNLQLQRQRCM